MTAIAYGCAAFTYLKIDKLMAGIMSLVISVGTYLIDFGQELPFATILTLWSLGLIVEALWDKIEVKGSKNKKPIYT